MLGLSKLNDEERNELLEEVYYKPRRQYEEYCRIYKLYGEEKAREYALKVNNGKFDIVLNPSLIEI